MFGLTRLCAITLFLFSAATLCQAQSPLDLSTFDKGVRVQDDLFMYVNGSWLRNTEIPSDKSNYGSFIQLDDLSRERIQAIIVGSMEVQHEPGTNAQKVADFYRAAMNEGLANQLGINPIVGMLREVAEIDSKEALWVHSGRMGSNGVRSPVGAFVGVDRKNPSRYLVNIVGMGTTLPDRDYYLKDDEKYLKDKAALVIYINRLFELAQMDERPGENILALESKLAEAQWSRVEMRDAEKTYNKVSVGELTTLSSRVPWAKMLDAAGVGEAQEVNVLTPSYFEKLDGIIDSVELATWKNYLQFRVLDRFAPFLAREFELAHFEFHEKQLAGIPEQQPRWKRSINLIGGALGEAVGELYVAEYFKPEAKARMNELVKNLLAAFDSSIDELAWMTDTTKVQAKDKLSKITTKIGYPDKWRDYSSLEVKPDDLVGNVIRSAQFESNRQTSRLNKPVDRTEWGMTPQTVNAYYNPPLNEIVFPAAILQPPFFDLNGPDALNYGGIGAVIGHEISHAFDDQGSRYDGDGNLRNWWTDDDRQAFESLTKRLIAQYDQYEPLPGMNVKGAFTLGENIADLSGLAIAYKAYKIAREGKPEESFEDWNGDQLFFIGWSRVWQRKYRDAEMVKRLATDPHAPSHYRANGPVTNIDAFYEAFEVKETDGLFKPVADRIRIW